MCDPLRRAPPDDLRSFGRRRGRKPSSRQIELWRDGLPGYALDINNPAPARLGDLFRTTTADVWLEIGFGGGEHLVWQMSRHPDVGFIGCEPFADGVVKALAAAEEHDLDNLRLHADDARPLLRWLPPGSLGRVFILFPDPWPKRRQRKRRLVNGALVDLLARAMKPRAELRLATDIGDYARTMLLAIQAHGGFCWQAATAADWRERGPDWPPTRYEEKARSAGRRNYYLRFIRGG